MTNPQRKPSRDRTAIASTIAIVRDKPGQQRTAAPDEPTHTPTTYTLAAIAIELDVNESTLRRRWLPKLIQAYEHYPEPIRVEVRRTNSGAPVFEVTRYGREAIRAYKAINQRGQGDGSYLADIRDKHPHPPDTEADKPAYLALLSPDIETDEADKASMTIVLDVEVLETEIQDYHAVQEVTDLGAIDLSNLLTSASTALTTAAFQQGRTAGAQAAEAWQSGANEAIAEVMQATVHAAQGKSNDSRGS